FEIQPGPLAARLSRDRSGDQPRPAPARDEAEEPADEDQDPVLESDEVPEVHDQPGRPREEPAQPDRVEVGDRAGAADGGEVALVAIVEGADFAPANPRANQLRPVAPLLHGDRRDPG